MGKLTTPAEYLEDQELYFFDCETTEETYVTENRELAFERYNKCMFPCELFRAGILIATQDFEEDELTGEVYLLNQIYPTTATDTIYDSI